MAKMQLRRCFDLPEEDCTFLDRYDCRWETVENGSQWVLIHDFSTRHPGYHPATVTAAIRIEVGYPQAPLDMVYFYPPITRKDGKTINGTESEQEIDKKKFQRWSRHYTDENSWVIGEYNLETHVCIIEDWLEREFEYKP